MVMGVEICVEYCGMYVFHVCFDLCVVYGVGVCINACDVFCVAECCFVSCVWVFVLVSRWCVECCDFCLICDSCSWRCSLMGSVCVYRVDVV